MATAQTIMAITRNFAQAICSGEGMADAIFYSGSLGRMTRTWLDRWLGAQAGARRFHRRTKRQHLVQVRDLKQVQHLAVRARNAKLATTAVQRSKTVGHDADPRAVHVVDAREIENNLPFILTK